MQVPQYIIFSTVYNEAELIRSVISSVLSLSRLPVKWYIFDDGSSDDTYKIISEFKSSRNLGFIELFRNKRGLNKGRENYFLRISENLDRLYKLASKEYPNVHYFLKLDGDTILSKDYLRIFDYVDSSYGCFGGGLYEKNNNMWKRNTLRSCYPFGTGLFINKKVLDFFGGWPYCAGSDTALFFAARKLNLWCGQIDKVKMYQLRPTSYRVKKPEILAIKHYSLKYPFVFSLCYGCNFFPNMDNIANYYKTLFKLYLKKQYCPRITQNLFSWFEYLRCLI